MCHDCDSYYCILTTSKKAAVNHCGMIGKVRNLAEEVYEVIVDGIAKFLKRFVSMKRRRFVLASRQNLLTKKEEILVKNKRFDDKIDEFLRNLPVLFARLKRGFKLRPSIFWYSTSSASP